MVNGFNDNEDNGGHIWPHGHGSDCGGMTRLCQHCVFGNIASHAG